ncbi:MAG: gliding motility-associated C-terminal domain-containing protein [Bacteroidetes bacterium]|nr:gliding motility-associated C-terminal domain-containing protein [Bacteroidota bacterium]
MKKFIGIFCIIFIYKTAFAQCNAPIINLASRVYCQDMGAAKMDSSVITPNSKFGIKQVWRILGTPNSVDSSKVLVDESNGSGLDWVLYFGKTTEDFYSGDYVLEYKVTNLLTGCYALDTTTVTIVTEPKVKIIQPDPVCMNADTIDLRKYVELNGVSPDINNYNKFKIVAYKNSRTDPKVISTKLNHGYQFTPLNSAGSWLIKFSSLETGCIKEDSFYLEILDTPNVILKQAITICSSDKPLDLSSRIDKINPTNATIIWSGFNVINGIFTPVSKDISTLEGPYAIQCKSVDNNGCKGIHIYSITVQSAPQIEFNKQWNTFTCASAPVQVEAIPKYSYLNQVNWSLDSNTDGTLDYPNNRACKYFPGPNSNASGRAILIAKTIAVPNGVCAAISDTLEITIYGYPKIQLSQSAAQCVPFKADFEALETSGLPDSNLIWRWNFGKGDTVLQNKVQGILYDQQGKYDVIVSVSNKLGPCVTTATYKEFVLAYPNPEADFSVDPSAQDVSFPIFQMKNNSKIDKHIFNSGLHYLWVFGDSVSHPYDTSTAFEPRAAYSQDTGTYQIQLIAVSDFGCRDTAYGKAIVFATTPPPLIPNAFSPEDDGPVSNNVFLPIVFSNKEYQLSVMNRNGDVVFISRDIKKGWDGRINGEIAPATVYFYRLQYKNVNNQIAKYKGTLLLLH